MTNLSEKHTNQSKNFTATNFLNHLFLILYLVRLVRKFSFVLYNFNYYYFILNLKNLNTILYYLYYKQLKVLKEKIFYILQILLIYYL